MKKLIILVLLITYNQTILSQKDVTLYWDASYSMKDRNIEREFNFLDNYFKKNSNTNIHLVTFSNTIILEENFTVTNSDWSNLKEELKNTIYDGATAFAKLFKHQAKEYLLFTDGLENVDELELESTIPLHIISTVAKADPKLKRISETSKGYYVVLNKDFNDASYKEGLVNSKKTETIEGYITGVTLEDNNILSGVNIFNKTSNLGATSGVDGAYKIKANAGDILVFTYLGKKTVNIRVTQANFLNVNMEDTKESLDEVIINANVEKEELINTGNTYTDKKRIGYAVQSISEDDVSELDTDVIGAVKGQFSNLEIRNDTYDKVDISQFKGRNKNMTLLLNQNGLVVIDGVPLAQSSSAVGGTSYSHDNVINPDLIADITYLKGLAATNKYGSMGAGGVLLITTKNAIAGKKQKKVKLGTTATYSESASAISKLPNTTYIKSLKNSETVDEAFKTYLEQRKKYGDKPEFYLDVSDYFKGWNNTYLSDRILSNIYELYFDNAEVLRALAYKQAENKLFEQSLFTYKRIQKLKPNQSQSYRDLAMAYNLAGSYQEALKTYDKIVKNRGVGAANFSGLDKTITNDFKNLINKHKNELNTVGVDQKYFNIAGQKKRIVFQWNNPLAQFDLQIVNPQKRFFTWSHTTQKEAQRLTQEKQQGYGLEEFFITDSDIGEWIFNIEYFGASNEKTIPTYLMITTYTNFGKTNESKEIKVIRLHEKKKLQTAVKLKI